MASSRAGEQKIVNLINNFRIAFFLKNTANYVKIFFALHTPKKRANNKGCSEWVSDNELIRLRP